MVTYTHIMIIAAIFSQTAPVLAGADSNESNEATSFSACMKQACPPYPESICEHTVVLKCHDQSGDGKAKRNTIDKVPSVEGSLEGRDFPALPPLTLGDGALCEQLHVPKFFVSAEDIDNNATAWCQDLKKGVLTKGVGYINQKWAHAVTKSADEIHGDKAVLINLVLTAYPPALAAFKGLQNADTLVNDGCTNALKALASAKTGCTESLKHKDGSILGAIPGAIEILNWGIHGRRDMVFEHAKWMFLRSEFLSPNLKPSKV